MTRQNIIGNALEEIYRWFDILNREYFDSELPPLILTIQKGRKNNLGWFTTKPLWKEIESTVSDENENETESNKTNENDEEHKDGSDEEVKAMYEINITAENLNRPVNEIVGTLQHELCHYANALKNIKDCNGAKHNKKFRDMAESKGLLCEKDSKYGFGITTIASDFNVYITDTIKPDNSVFTYFRSVFEKPTTEKKKTVIKYKCPKCGLEVKGKDEGLNIMCGNCEEKFEIDE